jgi:hypothetical protein
MRQGRRELSRRIARQLRVGIERDNVFHARESCRIAHDEGEAIGCAAQERVQVCQLAALSLAAHPRALRRIPAARAMEEEERVAALARVPRIEVLDAAACERHQRGILRERFLTRVLEIGEQPQVQVHVAVAEESNLERLDERIDAFAIREHRRHRHQGARQRRDPPREIHPRQQVRRGEQGSEPVHHAHHELARSHRQQECEYHEHRVGSASQVRAMPRRAGASRAVPRAIALP